MAPLRDHGTKSLAHVLTYAVGYAENGHAPLELAPRPRAGPGARRTEALAAAMYPHRRRAAAPRRAAAQSGAARRRAAPARRVVGLRPGGGPQRVEAARKAWREGFTPRRSCGRPGVPTMDTSGERHTGTLTAASPRRGGRAVPPGGPATTWTAELATDKTKVQFPAVAAACAVVGAGPNGPTAAVELARRGLSVAVFEAESTRGRPAHRGADAASASGTTRAPPNPLGTPARHAPGPGRPGAAHGAPLPGRQRRVSPARWANRRLLDTRSGATGV
ncbi:Gamma-glutamyltransferase OS=Streptomyces alboniger OX=132473 GN=CP975_29845 PE=4 SV=1 [Streptomyces alboniger]